jgi:glycosidase
MLLATTACVFDSDSQSQNMIKESKVEAQLQQEPQGKPVVYQVFTRLFGNKKTTNTPWGSKEENGVGKFSDFTDKALKEIKKAGVTHIWYTGILHHALVADYSQYSISADDPDVVKGRAGSPYAVKDYYNVNPDLALDVNNRLKEFEALIARTHKHGMKVIIDIIPNHIARNYHSVSKPDGVTDFGENDNTQVQYAKNNNFYYVVGEDFRVPEALNGYKPLGGDLHKAIDGIFIESPAKWTGNGSRKSQPDFNDWYETVKINYGVRPDGSKDFPELPQAYEKLGYQAHFAFWQKKILPDSWHKFNEITQFWLDKGVDGFRYDMAEMVPVEFWSYLNSSIKTKNPYATVIAEVYNPEMYRPFIHLGKMDYLYDKVDFYDTLKGIMQGKQTTSELVQAQNKVLDIEQHMIHFLENHDEQRIASPDFAGDANKGKPAMAVSTLISRSPTMLYFGQDVGEKAETDAGFGTPSRTSIFDYVGVPAHQRWMNDGAFDGGKLTDNEKQLHSYYSRLMKLSNNRAVAHGAYSPLIVQSADQHIKDSVLAFTRWQDTEKLIIINQFDTKNAHFSVEISDKIIQKWKIKDGRYSLTDLLSANNSLPRKESTLGVEGVLEVKNVLDVKGGKGMIKIDISSLESYVFKINL